MTIIVIAAKNHNSPTRLRKDLDFIDIYDNRKGSFSIELIKSSIILKNFYLTMILITES